MNRNCDRDCVPSRNVRKSRTVANNNNFLSGFDICIYMRNIINQKHCVKSREKW